MHGIRRRKFFIKVFRGVRGVLGGKTQGKGVKGPSFPRKTTLPFFNFVELTFVFVQAENGPSFGVRSFFN
jgi:hypothetical protein